MSALLFLNCRVLKLTLARQVRLRRPHRGKHLSAALSVAEVRSLLAQMSGTARPMAQLTYCAGLRLLELHRLALQDLDLEARRALVVEGKGHEDRHSLLPPRL